MSTSFFSPNFSTLTPLNSRSQTLGFNPLFYATTFSTHNHDDYDHGFPFPTNLKISQRSSNKRALVIQATPEAAAAGDFLSGVLPFWPPSDNSWLGWAVGLGVSLPLVTAQLIALSKQVEAAAEAVEKVAEVVENVAHDVDKAAEDFKVKLPDGRLKDIVESIEHLAEETAKDAHIVEDLMDKVEEVDEKLVEILSQKSEQAKASPTTEEKA
ncbi:PREDICTED: uncharacterized protein LOC109184813 [Ipomoea nil]|uniref:uncharacterized protein LOC109184813 n=1 Tax=Ipomoea nil TaxID=35883 RepID=UPI000901E418|nr:PREDICTED: uncharacterized protein LOC109184813 [Ipomoea nil]XP_019190404.1 PREDICTED: uncharacterized protein LOC109184813 [Ipomoea nil]XP_019190405.1 PREDICTED: uncharacterized protein LOC109184813 [Ipomoea nil]